MTVDFHNCMSDFSFDWDFRALKTRLIKRKEAKSRTISMKVELCESFIAQFEELQRNMRLIKLFLETDKSEVLKNDES